MPPVITSQQEDMVVSSAAILVLRCDATGDPPPTIAWFMDGDQVSATFVMSDGRLVRNVRDGDGASQAGIIYYCTATNTIGQSLSATARSRDIVVTYTCECGGCWECGFVKVVIEIGRCMYLAQ